MAMNRWYHFILSAKRMIGFNKRPSNSFQMIQRSIWNPLSILPMRFVKDFSLVKDN